MNSTKKRSYKQVYRQAWEDLIEFRGWLTESGDGTNRAYCSYCHKALHAHRLSLLKHTSTLKHQKAAEAVENENNKLSVEVKNPTKDSQNNKQTINTKSNTDSILTTDGKLAIISKVKKINLPTDKFQTTAVTKSFTIKNWNDDMKMAGQQLDSLNEDDNSMKKIQTLKECYEKNVFDDNEIALSSSNVKNNNSEEENEDEMDDDDDGEEEEEEMGEVEVLDQNFQNQEYFPLCSINEDHGYQKMHENVVEDLINESTTMSLEKPPISTHVLNTTTGKPGEDVKITLYKLSDNCWTKISTGVTNSDGRFVALTERNNFTVGRYKFHFDVDPYFKQSQTKSLYPFIEIAFECTAVNEHYHIPLLLNPFGYSTYRGS